ncbi:MAG TPA: hypothetical protein VJG48_01735 [Candidatus Paceibacterota bacterium]
MLRLQHCRNLEQYCKTRAALEAGEDQCPFCQPPDPEKVFYEDRFVVGRISDFPHKHTRYSFLVYPRAHIVSRANLGSEVWLGILKSWEVACDKSPVMGGALAIRFGDPRYNAGSVEHLHANILVPDLTGRVQVTLAKEPEEAQENIERAARFASVYERTDQEGYLPELVAGVRVPKEGFNWDGKADWVRA